MSHSSEAVKTPTGGGSGTLHFQGKRYGLRISGVGAGPLGAPRVDLVGRAFTICGPRPASTVLIRPLQPAVQEEFGCRTGTASFATARTTGRGHR